MYLLWDPADNALRRIGLDFRRFGSDVARGVALVALIGVPGIGVYAVGRLLGQSIAVVPAPLDSSWWVNAKHAKHKGYESFRSPLCGLPVV